MAIGFQASAGMFSGYVEYQEISYDDVSIAPMIVNGSDARISDFPYYARLANTDFANYYGGFCGGSVLNSEYILTAAHCLDDADVTQLAVIINNGSRAGVKMEELNAAESIHLHPDYNDGTLENDIAIIKLKEPLESYTSVYLPESVDEYKGLTTLTAMGMGYIDEIKTNPDHIQRGDVTKLSDEECSDLVTSTYGVPFHPENQECVLPKRNELDEVVSTCQGDSGGPLTYYSDGVYKQLGLTNYGSTLGCAHEQSPKVFAEILGHKEWIEGIAGDLDSGDKDEPGDDNSGSGDDYESDRDNYYDSQAGGSLGWFSLLALGLIRRRRK